MRKILYSLIIVVSAVAMTSCDDDDYYYSYDPYLQGMWQLTYINGVPVGGYDTNWLEFYDNGSGTYYYYSNGYICQMPLWFNTNYDNNWINIEYDDGVTLSCSYWFNSNATRLYMQWNDGYGQQQYVYDYVTNNNYPWYSAPQTDSQQPRVDKAALDTASSFGLRPALRSK